MRTFHRLHAVQFSLLYLFIQAGRVWDIVDEDFAVRGRLLDDNVGGFPPFLLRFPFTAIVTAAYKESYKVTNEVKTKRLFTMRFL